jgi:hypothetical protein
VRFHLRLASASSRETSSSALYAVAGYAVFTWLESTARRRGRLEGV